MESFSLVTPIGARPRAGVLHTPHGDVPTPAFMPVATQASVKSLSPEEVKSLGAQIVLSNTYHLYLRPGVDVIRKLGGLHNFMGWQGPILTDSGGFQVFSLASLRQISDDGVLFRSHIDGSEHYLTPELSIQLQEALGADIIMALDECPPYNGHASEAQEATARTALWAARCKAAHRREDQALFGIVQGGFSHELRRQSAEAIVSLGFDGYAIGGLSVGEPKALTWEVLERTEQHVPKERPRYLMGVGSPEDLVQAVAMGMDLFDCALPTRLARNGALFTHQGRVNILNARFTESAGPIEAGCDCYACGRYSSAYLHHLFKARELLAYRLGSIHNLRFIMRLMEGMRKAILEGTFEGFKGSFLRDYQPTDDEVRVAQKEKWVKRRGAYSAADE